MRRVSLARALLVGLLACGSTASDSLAPTTGETPDAGPVIVAPPSDAGGIVRGDSGADLTKDTDQDGVPDAVEGTGDDDGDGKPNFDDPINDGLPAAIKLIPISTNFTNPVGIDYHEPTNSVVLSVNYSTGSPVGFERIEFDGKHYPFSTLSGLTEEVKIATARSGNPGGFTVGDLFVGNGNDGEIARITAGGASVVNPWVTLAGDNNGLMRGSLYVDRTGVFGGDLLAATTLGELWRITAAGVATRVARVDGVHFEGLVVAPNKPARFGPLAGKALVGAEAQGLLYAFGTDGQYVTYTLGVNVEDIDLNTGKENFFGVDYAASKLLGADPSQWGTMVGDVILTQEFPAAGTSGLFRLKWDGTNVVAQLIPLTADSAPVSQWEHVTFAAAGIAELPPVPVVR